MSHTPEASAEPITVLGLGRMGSAIARALVGRGHPTTVWNRTAERSGPVVEAGASTSSTAAEAVMASSLVILCVLDYDAVDDVLATVGTAIAGRTLVNVTSGSPERARAVQRWAAEHDADYLDGGILGDPADVGSAGVILMLSGSRAAYDASELTLRELGSPTFYGDDAGLASVEFMAQVAFGYELLMGFLHTLHLVESEGVDPAEFAERVAGSVSSYGPLLSAMGAAVRDRSYPPDLGPLAVQAPLMVDLVEHRRSVGVDAVRMEEVKALMDSRVAAGHGHEGFSSLYALLGRKVRARPELGDLGDTP